MDESQFTPKPPIGRDIAIARSVEIGREDDIMAKGEVNFRPEFKTTPPELLPELI